MIAANDFAAVYFPGIVALAVGVLGLVGAAMIRRENRRFTQVVGTEPAHDGTGHPVLLVDQVGTLTNALGQVQEDFTICRDHLASALARIASLEQRLSTEGHS